ncbi:MAG: Zn-ribbon domain-containing OB-fold protein [Candidatus Heimdallarchaeota archaeon]
MTAHHIKEILPKSTQVTKAFWDAAKRHELLIQQCKKCGIHIFYPRAYCPECLSSDLEWVASSGEGTVYSYSIIYHSPIREFESLVPYILAIIELKEGVRIMSNIVNCEPEDIHVGMAVEVVYEDISKDISLPKFTPA